MFNTNWKQDWLKKKAKQDAVDKQVEDMMPTFNLYLQDLITRYKSYVEVTHDYDFYEFVVMCYEDVDVKDRYKRTLEFNLDVDTSCYVSRCNNTALIQITTKQVVSKWYWYDYKKLKLQD